MFNLKPVYKNDWISFYPKFSNLYLVYNIAGYFDKRPSIHCFLSHLLALVALPIVGINWFAFLLLIPFIFSWGELYIHLPIDSGIDNCEPPRYGIYYYESCFWICMGKKLKCIHMPYDYDWVRTSILLNNGEWEHETSKKRESFYLDKWKAFKWTEEHPYTYVLKSGKIQQRIATITVSEIEWRQRWLKWTKLFSKISRSVDVEFSYGGPINREVLFEKKSNKERNPEITSEVGERTGSWKGGTIGCSCELLPGQTPLEVLRKMERERKFD